MQAKKDGERVLLNHFGACPKCGRHDGYLNIVSDHIALCNTHKAAWVFGSNLISSWRDEDETIWRENDALLDDYEEVEPIHFADELPPMRRLLCFLRGLFSRV